MHTCIEYILIENLKSLRQVQLKGCKRINVFLGGPNSGKSNLLEALAVFSLPFLKENPSGKISQLIRMDNISELFYEGKREQPVKIKTNIGTACLTADPSGGIRVEIRMGNGIGDYRVDDRLNLRMGRNKDWLPTIKKYSFPSKTYFGKTQAPFLIPPFGDNLMEIIEGCPVLRNEISGLLKDRELLLDFDQESRSMKLKSAYRSENDPFLLPYGSLSETLRRIIFFKAAIASNNDSVILLEEPDARIFPSYIPMITQEIIHKSDNQYFITAQTPHLISEILEDSPEELAIYMLNYKDYQTTARLLSAEDILEYLR